MDMSMSMTMDMSTTSTMSGMAAATSGADMTMNMNGDGSTMMMTMGEMAMVFFSAIDTPLYTSSWTPATTGQYAGTCIFLIALAVIFRALLALRGSLEVTVWAAAAVDGHMPLLPGHHHHHHHRSEVGSDEAKIAPPTGLRAAWADRPPWQLRVDGWRAVIDTVLVGIGYLLMLAVMTMNVGYFASILAGTFVGSLLLGRFTHGAIPC